MKYKHGDKVLVSLDEKSIWAEYKLSFDKEEVTIDEFAGYWSDKLNKVIQDKTDDYVVEAYRIIEDNHAFIWTLDHFAPCVSEFLE